MGSYFSKKKSVNCFYTEANESFVYVIPLPFLFYYHTKMKISDIFSTDLSAIIY